MSNEERQRAVAEARATLHEFVPFPLYPQDKPDHVCNGHCACASCSMQKGDRAVHYQTRDRRRSNVPPTSDEKAAR